MGGVLVAVGGYYVFWDLSANYVPDFPVKLLRRLNSSTTYTDYKWTDLLLPAGTLLIVFASVKPDDPVMRYFLTHPKAALTPLKVSLTVGLVGSISYALVSQHWGVLLSCLPLLLFLLPFYKRLLSWAVHQKYAFLCVVGLILPVEAMMGATNWAMHNNFWETMVPVFVLTAPCMRLLFAILPLLSFEEERSSWIQSMRRFFVLGIDRETNDVVVFLSFPGAPLYIESETANKWDVYALDGARIDVLLEKNFALRPFSYPGKVRLVPTTELCVDKLRQRVLDCLPRFGKTPDPDAPLETLVDSFLEANQTVL